MGDLQDISQRLASVLPKRWFAENSPNVTAILQSLATPWVWIYGLVGYVAQQTRLLTASDEWLDLIGLDYFGTLVSRKPAEADESYRRRLIQALLQEAGTRRAVSEGIRALVGTKPVVFEPANCGDTGCYGSLLQSPGTAGFAYGMAGGWGSLSMPFQFFVTVTRPGLAGVGSLSGYGIVSGGYGEGAACYNDLAATPGEVTDREVCATLTRLLPVNAIAWLRIQ